MFRFITVLSISVAAFGASSAARGDEGPAKIVPHLPDQVFMPVDFDDNDNSQVVLYGTFPDTCWKVAGTKVEVDTPNRKIFIEDRALHSSAWVCADVISHYTKPVDLGPLAAGNYEILVENDGSSSAKWIKMGTLKVGKAHNPGPDDYFYAPVSESSFSRADKVLILRGDWGQPCLDMASIKVKALPGLIEILPIAEHHPGGDCDVGWYPFEEKVDLTGAAPGLTLIHIRSANGQAHNRVETL